MQEQISILGNKIDCFKGYTELYMHVLNDLRFNSRTGYVTVNNVHTMMEGFGKTSYQHIINNGYLSIPDGKPLEIFGKLKGNRQVSRLFGPTVMENFINWGQKDGISHFFLGSSESTLLKLRIVIKEKYPEAKIVGMVSPPFKPLEQWDNTEFLDAINSSKPDFIWVGLGAPKQEQWMYDYYQEINHGIMFGIGAGFDYLAGNIQHAPIWMKNASLEWLFRLVQEPRRLWKRYFKTIPPFMIFAFLEIMGVNIKTKKR